MYFSSCMIKDLLTLFDTNLTLSETPFELSDFQIVKADWMCSTWKENMTLEWVRTPYVKARFLPKQKSHIAVQFDARCNVPWKKTISDKYIQMIAEEFDDFKIVNIGDREFEFFENKTKIGLLDKFEIIASSQRYIGIDSGLSHLALMTNTDVNILYEGKENQPWLFYPDIGPFKQLFWNVKEYWDV